MSKWRKGRKDKEFKDAYHGRIAETQAGEILSEFAAEILVLDSWSRYGRQYWFGTDSSMPCWVMELYPSPLLVVRAPVPGSNGQSAPRVDLYCEPASLDFTRGIKWLKTSGLALKKLLYRQEDQCFRLFIQPLGCANDLLCLELNLVPNPDDDPVPVEALETGGLHWVVTLDKKE